MKHVVSLAELSEQLQATILKQNLQLTQLGGSLLYKKHADRLYRLDYPTPLLHVF